MCWDLAIVIQSHSKQMDSNKAYIGLHSPITSVKVVIKALAATAVQFLISYCAWNWYLSSVSGFGNQVSVYWMPAVAETASGRYL